MGLGFGIPKSVNERFVIFTEFSGSRVLKLGFHVFVQAMLWRVVDWGRTAETCRSETVLRFGKCI
jgi:hypothetical protein